jgi:hypothetical protein
MTALKFSNPKTITSFVSCVLHKNTRIHNTRSLFSFLITVLSLSYRPFKFSCSRDGMFQYLAHLYRDSNITKKLVRNAYMYLRKNLIHILYFLESNWIMKMTWDNWNISSLINIIINIIANKTLAEGSKDNCPPPPHAAEKM